MSLRVIGENFDSYVTEQIDKRQEILNFKFNRSQEQLPLFNSNAPWLRLASSVDVTEDKIRELGLPLSLVGSSLAKNGILFGGKLNVDQRIIDEPGFESSLKFDYGQAFTEDFGIVPLPVLEGITVTALNQGSLRKATVKIKCFTPRQFDIIETLYLRLKYSMLIEWGHSLYIPNNSFEISSEDSYLTTVYDQFINGTIDYESLLLEIELERERRSGNYDAFIGQIVNYDWQMNGSEFDITLQILSAGDVIESLKINYVARNIAAEGRDNESYIDATVAKKDNSTLNLALYETRQKMINQRTVIAVGRNLNITQNLRNNNDSITDEGLVIPVDYSDKYKGPQYYAKLGYIMKLIQENSLLYVKAENGENLVPYFKCFEESFYKKGKMFTLPYQASYNPSICVIDFEKSNLFEFEKYNENGNAAKVSPSFTILGETGFRDKTNPYIGNIYHIYINLEYVTELLDSLSEEDDKRSNKLNKVSLFKLMRQIANDINDSLGSINNITVGYDHDTNTAFFYDKTAIPGYQPELDRIAVFNTVGTGLDINGKGTFLTNVQFKTELSKEVQSAMAIGAVGAPYVNSQAGEDATFFSTLNQGLQDRILQEKVDISLDTNKIDSELTSVESQRLNRQRLGEILYNFYVAEEDRNRSISNEAIRRAIRLASSIMPDRCVREATRGRFVPQGFIPINLTLEMHGLSGIKLFQQFQIDQTVLPSSYREKLNFIVKGINHTISLTGWTTTVETLTVSSYKFEEVEEEVEVIQESEIIKTEGEPNPEFKNYVINTPWSASFISWVMKEAGIRFISSPLHTTYINKNVNQKGWVFLNPNKEKPKVGDILCANAQTSKTRLSYTEDRPLKYSGKSHSDIVTSVAITERGLQAVGGNVTDRIRDLSVKLEDGLLPNTSPATGGTFFGILRYEGLTVAETRKLLKVIQQEQEIWRKNAELSTEFAAAEIQDLNPANWERLYEYYRAAGLTPPKPFL